MLKRVAFINLTLHEAKMKSSGKCISLFLNMPPLLTAYAMACINDKNMPLVTLLGDFMRLSKARYCIL